MCALLDCGNRRHVIEYRQNLKGWPAALVVLAILGLVIFQCARRIQTLDESARFAIGVSLVREYRGTGLQQQAQEYLKQKANGEASHEPSASSSPIPQVELALVGAHGSKDFLIAKVKVRVNGGPPPDGRAIRYLNLARSAKDGRWQVVADSDAYHYVTSILSPALPKPAN